ncbi:MAG: hypothetical protein MJ252_23640 [archaeon]|nr:hypothetical protein [archaeon]
MKYIYTSLSFPNKLKFLLIFSIAFSLCLRIQTEKKKHRLTSNENQSGNLSFYEAMKRISNSVYKLKSLEEVQSQLRHPSFHLKDFEIRDIFHHMSSTKDGKISDNDAKNFFNIFVEEFNKCDTNKKNLLDKAAFKNCMKTDIYLKEIQPAQKLQKFMENVTSVDGMSEFLFNLLDDNLKEGISFYEYFILRSIRYGWVKCSPNRDVIEEANFECAINSISNYKHMEHSELKALYNLAVKFSGGEGERDVDFLTYAHIVKSLMLYSLINQKSDEELTMREVTSALEQDILPQRYNKEIIDQLFNLIKDDYDPMRGMDATTFVFYDYFLRIFDKPNFIENKDNPRYLNQTEFKNLLMNNLLFPGDYREAVLSTVLFKGTTNESYSMETVNRPNNLEDLAEGNFISFVEKKRKGRKLMDIITKAKNYKKELKDLEEELFDINESTNRNFMTYFDFGSFVQISKIFDDLDPLQKGKLTAKELFDGFKSKTNLPSVSSQMKEKAKFFNMFPSTTYFDFLTTNMVLRVSDKVEPVLVGGKNLEEVDLKAIMKKMHLNNVPDDYLSSCKRGKSERRLHLYDSVCSFKVAIQRHLDYINTQTDYLVANQEKLNLTDTEFAHPVEAMKEEEAKK